MHKICGLVLLILLGNVFAAKAEEVFFSQEYELCMEQAETTAAMNLCIVEEIKKQDVRLNAAYEKLIADLPGDQQQKLWQAQLIWIQFRNAYMDFLHEYDDSPTARIVSSYWYLHSTAEQARQLEFLLSVNEEGDN